MTVLLDGLREAGADEQVAVLAERVAADSSLDDPRGVTVLLEWLRQAGADEQIAALLARNPAARAALDDPDGVSVLLAVLLDGLWEAGADQQIAALLARNPAARAALGDPVGVTFLLESLLEAGAGEQAAALAARAAAHAALDDPVGVASLLEWLLEAGAAEQAAALLARLPAVGMFGLFLEQEDRTDQFRFGRDPDGVPAAPWDWDDLDLRPAPRPQKQERRVQRPPRRSARGSLYGHRLQCRLPAARCRGRVWRRCVGRGGAAERLGGGTGARHRASRCLAKIIPGHPAGAVYPGAW